MANGEPDTLIMWKRIIDVALSLAALFVLAPVFFVVAMAILMESGSPVIFRQQRIGKAERTFPMLKFRSMLVGAEKIGPYFTVPDDQRITRVGKFIRRTSLDELPQLINVLSGDMSIVGPRPDTPEQKVNYVYSEWMLRCAVRPGLTGLAQARLRSNATAQQRLELDLAYVRNNSLWLDIRIMAATLGRLASKNTN